MAAPTIFKLIPKLCYHPRSANIRSLISLVQRYWISPFIILHKITICGVICIVIDSSSLKTINHDLIIVPKTFCQWKWPGLLCRNVFQIKIYYYPDFSNLRMETKSEMTRWLCSSLSSLPFKHITTSTSLKPRHNGSPFEVHLGFKEVEVLHVCVRLQDLLSQLGGKDVSL